MPLGNLTSQFFANVYLNELDYFIKQRLKAHYYIRYVDDFVLMHRSKKQLEVWKEHLVHFLSEQLKLTLHPDKSRIIPIYKGVDFVGFRNFYHHRLLRKRNIGSMKRKVEKYREGECNFKALLESYQGWQAHARWANTYKLREKIKRTMVDALWDKITFE